jgi:hypothetical protein
VITPQTQESGYWTKVLTNTFGFGNCGAQTISAGRARSTRTGLSEGIGQYQRLIDSSPPFWLNQKCPQRRRRNWIAFAEGDEYECVAALLWAARVSPS